MSNESQATVVPWLQYYPERGPTLLRNAVLAAACVGDRIIITYEPSTSSDDVADAVADIAVDVLPSFYLPGNADVYDPNFWIGVAGQISTLSIKFKSDGCLLYGEDLWGRYWRAAEEFDFARFEAAVGELRRVPGFMRIYWYHGLPPGTTGPPWERAVAAMTIVGRLLRPQIVWVDYGYARKTACGTAYGARFGAALKEIGGDVVSHLYMCGRASDWKPGDIGRLDAGHWAAYLNPQRWIWAPLESWPRLGLELVRLRRAQADERMRTAEKAIRFPDY